MYEKITSTASGLTTAIAIVLGFLVSISTLHAQVKLSANGPGDTYELIETQYGVEVPDCGHSGRHISEEWDNELNKYVFIFHAHRDQDDDRCINTDRQRTELRGRAGGLQGTEGSTTYYRWKFKLDAGFQESPNFTHIFQIKAYGNGHGSGSPILIITPRSTNKMEISHPGSGGVKATASLSLFRGVWCEAYVRTTHANNGSVEVVIKRLSDGQTLLSWSGSNIDMWEDGAGYGAPKFGIYRSLNSVSYLRDERVKFADFCVSRGSNLCPSDVGSVNSPPSVSVTAPSNNANFTAPASIGISANASDSDGSVTKVEFYQGSVKLGEDTSSPYSFTWSNVAAGTYALTARATDNDGAVTTSATVTVNVQATPGCQPVVASSDDGNVAANVLDNDLNTRWSADGDGQWIQFCLSNTATVTGTQIAFYKGNERQAIFDIQLSANGTSWTTAAANVQSSGTSLSLETFGITPQSAKYVRILGHGNSVNTWNSYTEVKISTQASTTCTEPVTASDDDGNVAANVLDNDLNTRWSASGDGQWISLCLDNTATVNGVQIAFYNGNARQGIFDIQVSVNGTSWTTVASNVYSSGTSLALETFGFSSQTAKYVRIVGHGNTVNAWNSYTEVRVNTGSSVSSVAGESLPVTQWISYPNPPQGEVTVAYELKEAGKVHLSIHDDSGTPVVILADDLVPAGPHRTTVDVSGLSRGLYYIRLQINGKADHRKLLIE